MQTRRFIVFLVLPLVGLPGPTAVRASDLEFERVVADRCLDLLPDDLAAFFRAHADELQERVVEPDAVWRRDAQLRERLDWHRVALDVAADEQRYDARLAAARNFPRDQAEAKRLYRKLSRHGGRGVLPWAVEDQYRQLIDAFRDGEAGQIVPAAGYLTHFAAEAAIPFNASANFDGKLTDNLHLGRVRLGHPHHPHRTVAARFAGELLRRNHHRYARLVEISRGDYDPVVEPFDRTRSVLLMALSVLDEVAAADNRILREMQVTEAPQFMARADEYYQLLDEACGVVCVDRLRDGAVLAANLIGGAWEAAGRPRLTLQAPVVERSTTDREPPAAATPRAPDPPTGSAELHDHTLVGSRHSVVFHFYECRWARRIAPENLVVFESVEAAVAKGRRPCRFCKPAVSQP